MHTLLIWSFQESREERWSRRTKYSDEDDQHVVAVFVEVDANCPDQSVEIVASVNLPFEPTDIQADKPSIAEEISESVTESSSAIGLQPPRYPDKKKLFNIVCL